jgi:hypothetical protein
MLFLIEKIHRDVGNGVILLDQDLHAIVERRGLDSLSLGEGKGAREQSGNRESHWSNLSGSRAADAARS